MFAVTGECSEHSTRELDVILGWGYARKFAVGSGTARVAKPAEHGTLHLHSVGKTRLGAREAIHLVAEGTEPRRTGGDAT